MIKVDTYSACYILTLPEGVEPPPFSSVSVEGIVVDKKDREKLIEWLKGY